MNFARRACCTLYRIEPWPAAGWARLVYDSLVLSALRAFARSTTAEPHNSLMNSDVWVSRDI
jgi:hypothetical protein